ncbi:MAG: sigma-70 family RNA polymerase sigma factor [Bacteroidales bacterium]|nr:sigma-70 family RNA polymerase sigma factor [Bacteroidales bacterium]
MFLRRIFKSEQPKTLHSLADEELVDSFKKTGDTLFVGELFERYTHLLFGVCMKYLKDEENSKDAVMQIFEELHIKLKEHSIENFKNWIWSVAKNHCLMQLRKENATRAMKENVYQKIHAEIMESQMDLHPVNNREPEDPVPKMMKGLENLKSEQRTCLELLYLQNKSYREVAEITGYSMKNVKSHIQNGKRNLKIFMETK